MSEPGDGAPPDRPRETQELAPDEAFSLLGDETRLAIVTALHDGVEAPTQFSELYAEVGVDDTGRFNYHLDQLVPHFVSRTDAGYELTSAGKRIARAVAAGSYTDSPRLLPFEMEGACPACGATALEGEYRDEMFSIRCRDCEEQVLRVAVVPSLVRGRDPATFVDVFDRWSRAQVEQARKGFCPDCGGPVEPSVEAATSDLPRFDVIARFRCAVCGLDRPTSFGALATRHPPVETFHRRRGSGVHDRPYWEIPQCVSGDHVQIVSRDPWRIRVSFHADGDACRVTFDGDLEVVSTEVVRGEGPGDA